MSEIELLVASSKAAGIVGDIKDTADVALWLFCHDGSGPWNPLVNDGDALRLAVTLDIDVGFSDLTKQTQALATDKRGDVVERLERWGTDKPAATRRAIVRCAAVMNGSDE